MRGYTRANRDRINAQRRDRRQKNPEPKREQDRVYRRKNRDKLNASRRGERNRLQNEKAKARKRAWYLANKERIALETKARIAAKKDADPAAFRAAVAKRARLRRATDPKARLHSRVSSLVKNYLKRRQSSKGGVSWTSLVGYTVEQLGRRLRRTIPAGYSWQDYLSGILEIDHIVPVSAHNFKSPHDIDFRRCWALSNLRLLPREQNYEKRAKLLGPFQPALLLAEPRGAVE